MFFFFFSLFHFGASKSRRALAEGDFRKLFSEAKLRAE